MREVLEQLLSRCRAGETVGLALVVATWSSAPRPPGAAMLVAADGSVTGSVSGGCVEADVHAVAEEVLADGVPRLRRYGVSDADAATVGLTCGGTVEVFVSAVSAATAPELEPLAAAVRAGKPVALATVVEHPDPEVRGRRLLVSADGTEGTLGRARTDAAATDDVRGLLAAGASDTLRYGPDGQRRGEGMRVFAAVLAPRPRMLVFGASDFAAAVAEVGAFLGYRVTVCDARARFATAERFPAAEELVLDWPHRYLAAEAEAGRLDDRSVVCVLTHDPKFDVPLLEVALRLPVGYVGAMGSRRTHEDRLDRLREAGVGEAELARLASPIGLDLGARTPAETAVSVAAEIVRSRWGGGGRPLREVGGRIHHERG